MLALRLRAGDAEMRVLGLVGAAQQTRECATRRPQGGEEVGKCAKCLNWQWKHIEREMLERVIRGNDTKSFEIVNFYFFNRFVILRSPLPLPSHTNLPL